MDATETALAFVAAINAGRVDRMAELLAENHTFVDSDGTAISGRETIRQSWTKYFETIPDYRIDVEETFHRESTVVLLGTAAGTFARTGALDPANRWTVPAAWRIVVENGRIAVWQLYVNPGPMLEILERLHSTPG